MNSIKKNIILKTDHRAESKFNSYPDEVRTKLSFLRSLIIETAEENKTISELEETLKWGEPSYLTKQGSTLRIDWKEKTPDQYAMYFKCTSKLIPTIKELFGDAFNYENTRAVIFKMDEDIPIKKLKHCIDMALTYHKIKQLPLLGKINLKASPPT